jgi:hypothetical protein
VWLKATFTVAWGTAPGIRFVTNPIGRRPYSLALLRDVNMAFGQKDFVFRLPGAMLQATVKNGLRPNLLLSESVQLQKSRVGLPDQGLRNVSLVTISPMIDRSP